MNDVPKEVHIKGMAGGVWIFGYLTNGASVGWSKLSVCMRRNRQHDNSQGLEDHLAVVCKAIGHLS